MKPFDIAIRATLAHQLDALPDACLVNAAQAAVILGCCDKTVRRRIKEGSIPTVRLGGKERIQMRTLRGK